MDEMVLAEVTGVVDLSLTEACLRFPREAKACNLRHMAKRWRGGKVRCIVLSKARPAPEYVNLSAGFLGLASQFVGKDGTPRFCHEKDLHKTVAVTQSNGEVVHKRLMRSWGETVNQGLMRSFGRNSCSCSRSSAADGGGGSRHGVGTADSALPAAATITGSRFKRENMLGLYRYIVRAMHPAGRSSPSALKSFWNDAFVQSMLPSFKEHLHHAKQRSVQAGCREMYVRDCAPTKDTKMSPADFEIEAVTRPDGTKIRHATILSAILWPEDHARYIELSGTLLKNIEQHARCVRLSGIKPKESKVRKRQLTQPFARLQDSVPLEKLLLEFLEIDLRIEHGKSIAWVAEKDLDDEYDRRVLEHMARMREMEEDGDLSPPITTLS